MLSFSQFLTEAYVTDKPDVRSAEVSSNEKYSDPSKFRRDAEKIGEVGNMHLYASHNTGGGMTHYTWNPEDKKIHHVLTATEATKSDNGNIRLKYLTAHARKNSPVKMHQVYHALITKHNRTLVGTSHSKGAVKLWDRLKQNHDIHIHGENPDGSKVEIKPGDQTHVSPNAKTPEEKKIGRMALIAKAKNGN